MAAEFDPIPILKSDSPREKALKKRMNKQHTYGHHGKKKASDNADSRKQQQD